MAINSSNSSPRTTNTKGSPRRLFELLKEKQEPFVLEIYLLERGFRRKRLELDGIHVGCCSTNQHSKISSKFLRKSSNHHGKNGIRKSSSQFSSVAKRLYNKIVMVNGVVETKHNSDSKNRRRKDKEVEEQGRCCTASCSSSTLSNNARSEIDTEENNMCIPVSVLDEIDLLQAIPVYNNVRQNQEAQTTASSGVIGYQKKELEDSILSASSLWEMLAQARKQKHNKFGSNKSFPRYMNSKKRLQKTRQLLFDCVREVIEHTRNGTEQGVRTQKGQMGPEDIGKIIRNNLKSWGRISAHETSTKKLLRMDLLSSTDAEWNSFEECKGDMAMEIGDHVLEGITDEIVRDMFDV